MSDDRRVDFNELNWLGKTVFVGGAALRLTANLLDRAADRAVTIASESKRAYQREIDPNIEDATVLEETTDTDGSRSTTASDRSDS
jgi:hypothetical protein